MKLFTIIYLNLILCTTLFAQNTPPKPYGAIPSKRQLAWQNVELYGLIHFTPTTFEDKEWGYGDADPKMFNPTTFNAEQIVLAAKAGGLRAIILVAKHHDGFALWPTKTTPYNISKSPYKNGKADIVKEFETAARKHGLKFGVYCSPWDRNNPYYGTEKYLAIYQEQLRELYTNYGPLFMSWHDGANGGDGYYGGAREKRSIDNTTYYDWNNTWKITRKLQPTANILVMLVLIYVGWVTKTEQLLKRVGPLLHLCRHKEKMLQYQAKPTILKAQVELEMESFGCLQNVMCP